MIVFLHVGKQLFAMGQLIAAGILQSGAKFPIFSTTVYEYITGKPMSSLSPDLGSIPDQTVVSFLENVRSLKSINWVSVCCKCLPTDLYNPALELDS